LIRLVGKVGSFLKGFTRQFKDCKKEKYSIPLKSLILEKLTSKLVALVINELFISKESPEKADEKPADCSAITKL
jgi:hypothetical protein